jgi:hypothetical protein
MLKVTYVAEAARQVGIFVFNLSAYMSGRLPRSFVATFRCPTVMEWYMAAHSIPYGTLEVRKEMLTLWYSRNHQSSSNGRIYY